LNIDTLTGGNCLPQLEEMVERKIVCYDYGMDMTVPVSGSACDFQNERAAENTVLPGGALSKASEAFHEVFEHLWKIGLVTDRQSEMFDSSATRDIRIPDEEFKPALYSSEPRN